jgi:D-3-phosphoglycerate dehydrogenase
VTMDELLMEADFVSLHAPSTDDTRHLVGAEQLALMKPGAVLINTARGELVDERALAEALRAGKIGGAALDVFSQEPPESFELIDLPNVVATPHLGASTVEAQIQVAVDVARQVAEVLSGRPPRTPVNVPAFSPEVMQALAPFLELAERIGRLQAQLLQGGITQVELTYAGELAEEEVAPLRLHFLVGLLTPILSGAVNVVNASVVAEQRGIEVVEAKNYVPQDYASLLSTTVKSEGGEMRVAGTVFGKADARIVEVDRYRIDLVPSGLNLFVWHKDQPGIIGRVGTILGNSRINIGGMQVGRQCVGGEAVMALTVDEAIPLEVCREIEAGPGITRAVAADLDGGKG